MIQGAGFIGEYADQVSPTTLGATGTDVISDALSPTQVVGADTFEASSTVGGGIQETDMTNVGSSTKQAVLDLISQNPLATEEDRSVAAALAGGSYDSETKTVTFGGEKIQIPEPEPLLLSSGISGTPTSTIDLPDIVVKQDTKGTGQITASEAAEQRLTPIYESYLGENNKLFVRDLRTGKMYEVLPTGTPVDVSGGAVYTSSGLQMIGAVESIPYH